MSFHQLYLKNIYYYIVVRKAMPPTLSKKYLLLVRKAMPPTLSKKYLLLIRKAMQPTLSKKYLETRPLCPSGFPT
jgi:hypothetical protein